MVFLRMRTVSTRACVEKNEEEMASGGSSLPFAYISGEEVRRLVGMAELIQEMSRGLQWVSEQEQGGVVQPVRSVVRVDKYSGLVCSLGAMTSSLFLLATRRNLGVMPAYSSKSDSLGAKLVTFYSQQVEGIPSHQAIVVVLDPRTGSLQAVRPQQSQQANPDLSSSISRLWMGWRSLI